MQCSLKWCVPVEVDVCFLLPFLICTLRALLKQDADDNGEVSLDEWLIFWSKVKDHGYDEEDILAEVENITEGQAWIGFVRDGGSPQNLQVGEGDNSPPPYPRTNRTVSKSFRPGIGGEQEGLEGGDTHAESSDAAADTSGGAGGQ